MNLDAHVSAVEAAGYRPMKTAGVCRHLIYFWRAEGKLRQVGRRGRSPLYRWGDVLAVERDTRLSPLGAPRKKTCSSCQDARVLVAA